MHGAGLMDQSIHIVEAHQALDEAGSRPKDQGLAVPVLLHERSHAGRCQDGLRAWVQWGMCTLRASWNHKARGAAIATLLDL